MSTLLQDLRFGLRMLAKNPGFTAVAVLTLALGIGANTAIFALINAAMLKTLPVGEPGELVILQWTARHSPRTNGYSTGPCPPASPPPSGCSFPYAAFLQFRSAQNELAGVMAGTTEQLTAIANGHAAFAPAELVSGDFFTTLRVSAVAGRTLGTEDDKPGAAPATVISYGYWMGKLGGDPGVIGKTLLLNGVPFTVVGVAEPRFTGVYQAMQVEIWAPLADMPLLHPDRGHTLASDRGWFLWVVGRLKPGVPPERARATLQVLFSQSVNSGPTRAFKPDDKAHIDLASGSTGFGLLQFYLAKPLFLLMSVVGMILLMACANLANLMLAKGEGRQREIMMRIALGAGRARLVQQFLTESLLLSGMGAVAGFMLASWGSRAAASFISAVGSGAVVIDVNPDARVFAFTAALAILTALLFGLAPALHGTRVDLTAAMKASRGSPSAGTLRRRALLRPGLVVCQLTLAVPVLVGTGLLVRTLVKLESVQPGFNPRNILLFNVRPDLSGYKDERLSNLYANVLERLRGVPGVVSATVTQVGLVSWGRESGDVWIEGHTRHEEVDILRVGPEFLETMQIPLLAGRTITRQDFLGKQKVALVNRTMARELFPNEEPLGRHFGWNKDQRSEYEVVGIVGDTKYDNLRKPVKPTIYLPQTSGRGTFEVRTAGDPETLIPAVRSAVELVDRNLPIDSIRTQSGQIQQSLFLERLLAGLCGLFAALALALACVGLYGVVSYRAAQRTNEIGIRMALGAERNDVLKMILRQGLAPVLVGLTLGLAAAIAVCRVLASFLYGVRPTDPATIIGVSVLLIAVAFVATYIPARRATKVDPMVALRYE